MTNRSFEEELRALLADHEVEPPASWIGITKKLSPHRYIIVGAASLIPILLLLLAWLLPKSFDNPAATPERTPQRLILMIDSSYLEDGSLRLDTIYQD